MENIIYPENLNNSYTNSFFTDKTFDIKKFSEKYQVYMPIQKHTDRVLIFSEDRNPKIADAVITSKKGIFIGVKVADCLPILLADSTKKVIAAVHAGWRSTAKGILKNTLKQMYDLFSCRSKDIFIAMGPSIRGCCYEVGQEVIDALKAQTLSDEYIVCLNGKKHIDLAIANKIQVLSMGININNIWVSKDCTYCNHERYFSYRFHGKEAGRQYGIIGMLEL